MEPIIKVVPAGTYRFKAQVIKIMRRAKANPRPRIIPYPNPWDKGAVKVTVPVDMARDQSN